MNTMFENALADSVWVDDERMGGVACFKNTRVPVVSLFDWLAHGESLDFFLEQFPSVTRAQAQAVLEWSKRELCKESAALESFA